MSTSQPKKSTRLGITLSDLGIDSYNRYRILLIGCGGTGSLMLTALARINETLELLSTTSIFVCAMDDDIFEEHNVGRQACSYADVGKFKAEVMINRINRFYGNDWIYSLERYTDMYDSIKSWDFIILAVDNVKTRLSVFKNPKIQSTIIDIGNGANHGQVIMSKKHIMPDTEKLFHISTTPEDESPSCSAVESLSKQSLFINTFAAMYAAQMLSDLLIDRYVTYNQVFFSINPFNVKSNLKFYETNNRKKRLPKTS